MEKYPFLEKCLFFRKFQPDFVQKNFVPKSHLALKSPLPLNIDQRSKELWLVK